MPGYPSRQNKRELNAQDVSKRMARHTVLEFHEAVIDEPCRPEFCQAFYEQVFKRHHNWEQLSLSWRKEMEGCAELIVARSKLVYSVLAVGCGFCAIERYLQGQRQSIDLFIHEVASSPWRWVGAEFADKRKFLGFIPACLHQGISFDLIYP